MGMTAHNGVAHAVGNAKGAPYLAGSFRRLVVGTFCKPLVVGVAKDEQGAWSYECRKFVMVDGQTVNAVGERRMLSLNHA